MCVVVVWWVIFYLPHPPPSVVLIHKDPSASSNATVTVTPPAGSALQANATLVRMLARGNNPSETEAITFAGQTYAGSTDGLPTGSAVEERVFVDARGDFVFSLPPASAAILTMRPA